MKSLITRIADALLYHCIDWQDRNRAARLYVDLIVRPVLRTLERIEAW